MLSRFVSWGKGSGGCEKIDFFFLLSPRYIQLLTAHSTNSHISMPTMKQVDEMIMALADEFDFSEREARIFLKLPCQVPTPSIPRPSPATSPRASPKASPKTSPTSTPRGPSAYNMFVKSEASKVKAKLEKEANGAKLERGAVMKELGSQWKAMSDAKKAKWAP